MAHRLLPTYGYQCPYFMSQVPTILDKTHPQLDGCVSLYVPALQADHDQVDEVLYGTASAPLNTLNEWIITDDGMGVLSPIIAQNCLMLAGNDPIQDPFTNNWEGFTLIWDGYIFDIDYIGVLFVKEANVGAALGINYGLSRNRDDGGIVVHALGSLITSNQWYYDTGLIFANTRVFMAATLDDNSRDMFFHYSTDNIGLIRDLTGYTIVTGGVNFRPSDTKPLGFNNFVEYGNRCQRNHFYQCRIYNRPLDYEEIEDIFYNRYAPFVPATIPAYGEVQVGPPVITAPDTGSGLDDLPAGIPLVDLAVSDTGGSTDETLQLALFFIYDFSSATDEVPQANVTITVTGTGAGADVVNVTQSMLIDVFDSGLGDDGSVTLNATLPVLEAGLGTDTPIISYTAVVNDTTSSVDAVTVLTEIVRQVMDTGSAAENVIIPESAIMDVGLAADDVPYPSVTLTINDIGTAAIEAVTAIISTIQVLDTALGSDVVVPITAQVLVSDTGLGTDASEIIEAFIQVADQIGGSDVVVTFESGTRIARIEFTVKAKKIKFRVQ